MNYFNLMTIKMICLVFNPLQFTDVVHIKVYIQRICVKPPSQVLNPGHRRKEHNIFPDIRDMKNF